jgi:formylglycine-generating enzyme required for sulfatase activity
LQDDSHPVVCVNRDDANAYVAWLSAKVGQEYRLPSEAEWEYAARAGTVTSRYWGDDPRLTCLHANGADQSARRHIPGAGDWAIHECDDGYAYTSPAGRFQANAFGLKDMLGNAWEWTEDCWHDNYIGAPTDGSPWTSGGECGELVLRGGAWDYGPQLLRSAYRSRVGAANRDVGLGFRVARALR